MGTHASTSSDTAPPVEKTTPPSSFVTLIEPSSIWEASILISPSSVVKLNLPSSMSSKLTVISSPVSVLRTVIVPASSSVETSSSSGLSLTIMRAVANAGFSSKSAATSLTLRATKKPPTITTTKTRIINAPQPIPTHAQTGRPFFAGACSPLLITSSYSNR
jgi:hypothetical protein